MLLRNLWNYTCRMLTRKEHIVSRMLLQQFVAADGMLRVYSKGKPIRRSRPENECVERDFFEFELRGKRTDNRYEKWLSRIEADAKPLLKSVIERRMFSQRDAELWARFVASQFGRTRKVQAHISEMMTQRFREQAQHPDFISNLQVSLLKEGEFHYAEDLKRAVNEIRTAMDASPNYYHVSALPNRVRIIAQPLLTRAWHTIEAPPDHYFLMSDCPVVTYEVRDGRPCPGTGFGNENAVAMMPVSPRHLFVAAPHTMNWRQVATISGMWNINRLIVQFAHKNVYANVESEEAQALVNDEINSLVFGKNAFVPQTN